METPLFCVLPEWTDQYGTWQKTPRRPARCTILPPACAEHSALLLISSVRRSNVISCSLPAPPLPPPPPTEPCTVPFCQNLVPQATDLPIVSVLFLGWGDYCSPKQTVRGRENWGTAGQQKRRGVEILYLGCTCVCEWVLVGWKYSERWVFFSPPNSSPTPYPSLRPKLTTALSAGAAPCCLPCGEYKQIILGSLSGRHQLWWRPQNAHSACVYRVEGRP